MSCGFMHSREQEWFSTHGLWPHVSVAFLRGLEKQLLKARQARELRSLAQGLTTAGKRLEIYTLSKSLLMWWLQNQQFSFLLLFFFFSVVSVIEKDRACEPGKTRKAERPNRWLGAWRDARRLWSVDKILLFFDPVFSCLLLSFLF